MRMMGKAAMAAAATLAIAGAGHAMPNADYVKKAGASDLFEIKSAKLMLTSTQDPGIRKFATQMVTDHNKSTDMVKAAAMKAGMHPAPPMLDSQQQSMYNDLMAAKGPARDSLYLSQQKQSHQMALDVQQDEASSGMAAPLKMAAGKIVPVVQHHISMLDSMPAS